MLTDDIKTIESVNSQQYSVHDNVIEAWGRIKAACNKVESASSNISIPKLLDQFEVFIKLISLGDEKAVGEALGLIKQLRQ